MERKEKKTEREREGKFQIVRGGERFSLCVCAYVCEPERQERRERAVRTT